MTTKIRPGILVAVRSSVQGGVSYQRRDLSPDGESSGETETIERWETTKVTVDAAEHERATRARSLACAAIRSACAQTAFGLLCAESDEAALDEGIRKARAICAEHNATAEHTTVGVRVLKGRVASTDEEAARAVGAEVASLIEQMSAAVDRLDPAAIREAAQKAREIAAVLDPEQEAKVGAAVKAARAAAKEIVRRIEKGGEPAAVVVADLRLGAIEAARCAFIEVDDEIEVEETPAPEAARFAGIDGDEDGVSTQAAE